MRKLLNIIIFLILPYSLPAQITPLSSQYILNPLTINPAYAGNRGALNVAAFYRKQWVGVPGSPETMTLSADALFLDSKLGLGFMIANDKLGVTKENHISTAYAYRIAMEAGTLAFGLGAGLITTNTAYSDLIAIDPGDEEFLTDSRLFVVPEFSFGVSYSYRDFYVGFSIPRLIGYDFNYDKNKYSLTVDPGRYNYLFNTGYLFTLGSNLKFMPSSLVSISPGKKVLFDLNAHFNIYNRFWTGLSYRSSKSLSALLQFSVIDQLKVAYTYDFDFGDLRKYSNGSHEVMIRYEFRYRVNAVNPLVF